MTRLDPPRLAAWMLDHCIPGARDEALAGDLLEEFRAGRSSAWYWRQTLSACALGSFNNLNHNRLLVVFAAFWSMLAPAWTMLIDRFENNAAFFGQIWRMDFPFSSLAQLTIWMGANLIFLWTGMLFYLAPDAMHRRSLSRHRLKRAILVPLVMFNVVYIGAFVLMNLYEYPGPMVDRRTLTALGEIIDVRQWAVVLRLPYFLTMVCALWRTKAFAAPVFRAVVELASNGPSIPLPAPQMEMPAESHNIRGPIALFVGAGLLNSLIAAIVLCRLPESHFPSLPAVISRAALYVALVAMAGVAGAWFYWRRSSVAHQLSPVISFRLFALICAASWIWVPAVVLLVGQESPASAGIAALGGAILAIGLRKNVPVSNQISDADRSREMFADALAAPEIRLQGYIVALCIYCGAWAFRDHALATACTMLAVASFVIAWELILPSGLRSGCWGNRYAAQRLARIALPAVLITAWTLLDGVAHRNRLAAGAGSFDSSKDEVTASRPASDLAGYESIILWPYPEKKQIVPPVQFRSSLFGPGKWQPLIIRFDGPYYYFQPGRRPESDADQAKGSPLSARIESSNFRPLTMEAHQTLGDPIPFVHCREIEVQVRNRDNDRGVVALAVLLRDSTAPHKSGLYLGQQTISSTMPEQFTFKISPVYETLRFEVPVHADIRKFDEITVMLLPDIEHALIAPKIAIEQFQLYPR